MGVSMRGVVCVSHLRPVDAALQIQIHLAMFPHSPSVLKFQRVSPIPPLIPKAKTRKNRHIPDRRERSHGAYPSLPPVPAFIPPSHPAVVKPQKGPVRLQLSPSQSATLNPAPTAPPSPPSSPPSLFAVDAPAPGVPALPPAVRNPTRGCRLSTVAYRTCAGRPTPLVQKLYWFRRPLYHLFPPSSEPSSQIAVEFVLGHEGEGQA